MTISERATSKTLEYIRSGMNPREAVRRACAEAIQEGSGLGDFAEGWDTFTTYAPWIGAGIAGFLVYKAGQKAYNAGASAVRSVTDYIAVKKRKAAAAKAAWDATA